MSLVSCISVWGNTRSNRNDASIDTYDVSSTGLAPLHLAVIKNQIEMVKVLIRCGADINIQVRELRNRERAWTADKNIFIHDQDFLNLSEFLARTRQEDHHLLLFSSMNSYMILQCGSSFRLWFCIKIYNKVGWFYWVKSCGCHIHVQYNKYNKLTIYNIFKFVIILHCLQMHYWNWECFQNYWPQILSIITKYAFVINLLQFSF